MHGHDHGHDYDPLAAVYFGSSKCGSLQTQDLAAVQEQDQSQGLSGSRRFLEELEIRARPSLGAVSQPYKSG